jgi:hypothetical protein
MMMPFIVLTETKHDDKRCRVIQMTGASKRTPLLEAHAALVSIIVLALSKCRSTMDRALLAAGSNDIQ